MPIDLFVQQKLKQLREANQLTLEQLARKLDTTAITLSRYETGKRSVSLCILEEICKVYGLSVATFFNDTSLLRSSLSKHDIERPIATDSVFIYGQIAAGRFSDAIEEYIDEIEIPRHLAARHDPKNLFGLRVNGNSMNKIVQDSDYVVLVRQQVATSGDIVAVMLNDESATLKKFYQIDNETIVLKPESHDPDYAPITLDLRNSHTQLRIIGKVVWHCAARYN